MGETNQTRNMEYKIGLFGPTRVGKTSMIASLLEEGQKLLAGTDVSIDAVDDTVNRVNRYRDKLRGSLMVGEFNPGGLSGSQELIKMELAISVGTSKLSWAILDYPGSWINETTRPPESQNDWNYCQEWIKESIVFLVPIDAAVVMESTTGEERGLASETLQITQAAKVASEWVKGRIKKQEPGLLILVPVKCETYFSDNAGKNDKSADLFDRIQMFYRDVIDAVHQEINGAKNNPETYCPEILIQYHPIDTIGCVEIKDAKWIKEEIGSEFQDEFQADYRVRPPHKFCPKGADGLLISICRQITTVEKNRNRNVFSNFWRWITKEDEQLNTAIQTLQAKNLGTRVKHL
jgi:hypothetical protein